MIHGFYCRQIHTTCSKNAYNLQQSNNTVGLVIVIHLFIYYCLSIVIKLVYSNFAIMLLIQPFLIMSCKLCD